MQISITRTGGYAGITEKIVNLDTSKLDPTSARAVEQAVQRSGLYGRSGDITENSVGADMLKYEINVTDGDRHRRCVFSDDGSAVTAPLVELVQKLVSISQSK